MVGVVKSSKKFEILFLSMFFLMVVLISMQVKKSGGDDTNFTVQIMDSGAIQWVKNRYFEWSGRLFSDFAAGIFLPLNKIYWALTNGFFATLLLYSIKKLTLQYGLKGLLFSAASLGYIALGTLVDSSLWITGSFNYLWPISLGLFSLILVFNESRGIRTRFSFIYLLAAILSSLGVEQLTACLLCFSLLANFQFLILNRKINLHLFLYSIVVSISALIVMMSPGTKIRIAKDSIRWYPEFPTLSLSEKIISGVTWQLDYWIKYMSGIHIFLSIIIIYTFYKLNRKSILSNFFQVSMVGYLISFASFYIIDKAEKVSSLPVLSEFSLKGGILYLFWMGFFIVLYASMIFLSKNKIEDLFLIAAIILSASVMYFSPTIFASGARTMAVPFILTVLLVGRSATESAILEKNYLKYFFIFPAINLLYLVYWIHTSGFLPHSFW